MVNINTFEELLDNVKLYITSDEDIKKLKKAYEMADYYHKGITRESGEEYIVHPLNVAFILSNMHADIDTLCAALLHDTLEDTNITREEIVRELNIDVLNLVEGVTKISRMNFGSKEEQNYANTKKIINSLTSDVRIMIIKIADRLHNMRTLQYKTPLKQKENAMETLEVFSPIAYSLGAYKIKNELEDLSLRYLKPDFYQEITEKRERIIDDSKEMLRDILLEVDRIMEDKGLPRELKYRVKNIYGIYKNLTNGFRISEIHDLFSLKVIVDELYDCYTALGAIHQRFHPVNYMFKDYICNPKTNLYQSLHTTVFAGDGKLVQMQIRTPNMDLVDTYGIMRYFDIYRDNSRTEMQQRFKSQFQFYKSLLEINKTFADNKAFVDQVKRELFSEKVYVVNTVDGETIELPKGATAIDLAYKIHTQTGNTMVAAIVNDDYKEPYYILQNKDRVRIITDDLSFGPREEWMDKVQTAKAKRRILEFTQKID